MAAFGARPIGAAVGGIVGAHAAPGAAIHLAAAGFVLQGALILFSTVPSHTAAPRIGVPAA